MAIKKKWSQELDPVHTQNGERGIKLHLVKEQVSKKYVARWIDVFCFNFRPFKQGRGFLRIYLFVCSALPVLVAALRVFTWGSWTLSCGLWDLVPPTRDQPQAPCFGSPESQPLDHQGSPVDTFLKYHAVIGDRKMWNSFIPKKGWGETLQQLCLVEVSASLWWEVC